MAGTTAGATRRNREVSTRRNTTGARNAGRCGVAAWMTRLDVDQLPDLRKPVIPLEDLIARRAAPKPTATVSLPTSIPTEARAGRRSILI